MQITIDTNNLTDLDRAVMSFLAAGEEAIAEALVEEPAPAKPAKKAAPAVVVPEPTPEPAAEEDLLGSDGPTLADAVAAATRMVSSGKSATVKVALAAVGAKRVSEVPEDQVAAFLAALEA